LLGHRFLTPLPWSILQFLSSILDTELETKQLNARLRAARVEPTLARQIRLIRRSHRNKEYQKRLRASAAERVKTLEQENVSLRQELEELKKELAQYKAVSSPKMTACGEEVASDQPNTSSEPPPPQSVGPGDQLAGEADYASSSDGI
jgi:ATP-dependent Lon protease